MTIENMEGAIAMLEAYLSGGDELGIVSEDDASEALNFIRGAIEFMAEVNASESKSIDTLKADNELLRDRLGKRLEAYDAVLAERDDLRRIVNSYRMGWFRDAFFIECPVV